MKIFFDESGDFDLKQAGRFNFVGALLCPSSLYPKICESFGAFKRKISGSEDEIKGSDLTFEQRAELLIALTPFKEQIRVAITGIHPDHMNYSDLEEFRAREATNFEGNRKVFVEKFGEIESELAIYKKLIRTAANPESFSDPEYLQLHITSSSIHKALQTFCFNYLEPDHCPEYEDIHFIFDRKHPKKLSQMEKHLEKYLLGFWDAAFKSGNLEPLIIMPDFESHTRFNKKYKLENGKINLSLVFQNGLQFKDSKLEPGLQIIDIIVNTIYSAIHNPNDIRQRKMASALLSLSCRLMNQKIKYVTMRRE